MKALIPITATKNKTRGRKWIGLVIACVTLSWGNVAQAESLIHDKDRILFCGDSITAQGAKTVNGWVGLIGEGLNATHPLGNPQLITLGGSGMGIGAWLDCEKTSRDTPTFLDLPRVDVKATLDGGADVVVIMLGMNDLLSPSLTDTPGDLDAWQAKYRTLIDAIKARAHPRLIALATVTLCTEDGSSPKNHVADELNTRLMALAQLENAVVLPTRQTMLELLNQGREYKPEFHITNDFVHPNATGHLAIAVGMLRGLGEIAAATALLDKNTSLYQPADAEIPTLSSVLTLQDDSPDASVHHFLLHYLWKKGASSTVDPTVAITLPPTWTFSASSLTGTQGDFQIAGPLDHLVNKVTLSATAGDLQRQAEIDISAGWRIAVGQGGTAGWTNYLRDYDGSADHLALDRVLAQDASFTAPQTFPTGDTPPWKFYLSSINYLGYNAPGSIDMAAVTFFKLGDLAYGVRWIYSDKDRPVDVALKLQGWTGSHSLTVWLNDQQLYSGKLLTQPSGQTVKQAQLHQGWNRLLFKSTFIQWVWTFSIDITGVAGENLDDLRFATTPPPAASVQPTSKNP